MRHCVFLVAGVLALAGTTVSASGSVSAVRKVIELLANMQAKSRGLMREEAVAYSQFQQFCLDNKASLTKAIAHGSELVESLLTEIEKLELDIKQLESHIEELHRDVATYEADLKTARVEFAKEREGRAAWVSDLADSLDALNRAISVFERRDYNRAQAEEALVQLSASTTDIPDPVRRAVAAFLEEGEQQGVRGGKHPDENLFYKAPEARAYEFQSGGIVELLKRLRADFTQQHTEAEKEVINAQHAHDMKSQDLTDLVETATSDIADRTAEMQEKKQLAADAKKRVAATAAQRDEDKAYLKKLTVECDEKAKSFKEKQQLRTEEIQALQQASEILSSPAVFGAAQEHLPAFLFAQAQPSRSGGEGGGARLGTAAAAAAVSLAQLRGGAPAPEEEETGAAAGSGGGGGRSERLMAADRLARDGERLHSRRLAMLAEQLASSSDPFAKVKRLIESMIKQLLSEINQESEQKGFCDKELGTNKITRTRLQDGVDRLAARVDDAKASISEASQRITMLHNEVADIQTSIGKAVELRKAEKAENEAAIADAKAAQKAVIAAVQILKDFYEKASKATAFVQGDKGHKPGMQTFGDVYRGRREEAGGVFAMLEVVASDFAQLEVNTAAAEEEAARLHREFLAESSKSNAVKGKETEMLTADRADAEARLAVARRDLAATQDQLLAADRYYDKLKPSCVDTSVSYKERSRAREEEIQSLKEALRILRGEEMA